MCLWTKSATAFIAGLSSWREVNRANSAAEITGAEAVHPGYGFLSEQPAHQVDVAPGREADDQLGHRTTQLGERQCWNHP